ncbi:MAG: hypothetical protein GX060_04125 [Firmicutes bacterium]|nr:hypothetical protein [Bacillota bacterium]
MKQRISLLLAIVVTLLVILGLPRLPAIFGVGVPSWFSTAWLLLAILVLLSHMHRAEVLGRKRHDQPKRRERDRADQ